MPKRILEDIKPISRSPRRPNAATEVPIHVVKSLPREVVFEPTPPRRSSRYALWYVAVACVVGLLLAFSYVFESADVAITPKSLPVAFDTTQSFTADKDTTAADTIAYSEMTLTGDDSISLPSTITQTQSQAATGTVILYNAYSTASYKLVANTRLETPDGLVYKTNKAVVIPGYTGKGATLTPGSATVGVTAAAVGSDYDIAPSDFSVPGLAGTPQATKIYGRSAVAMSGGTSGTVYTVPASTATAAESTLQSQLQTMLMTKAEAQVPDGYILFPGATVFTPDPNVQVPYSQTTSVPLSLQGTLTAYIINESTLVTAIAESSVSQYNGEPVTIPDIASLTLVPSETLDPSTDTSFTFTFTGTATIVWTVDPSQVQTLLAGRGKNEFETLISGLVGVDQAQVTIKPFWKQTFPTDQTRIHVTIQKPV